MINPFYCIIKSLKNHELTLAFSSTIPVWALRPDAHDDMLDALRQFNKAVLDRLRRL